ncbi:MAG TPA: helix-turn-helix domain-containing protein [Streptosporangiaceae bacterium]|nr:helix-turn-helix domain-containing protein [Streptosporangiaceae bacterium]
MTDEPPRQPAAEPGRIFSMQDFGRELTVAREHAGLTIRDVARSVGLPASTAGDYFAGRHLPPPTQPGLLARILEACGETDPARVGEWEDALSRVRRGPGRRQARGSTPYRGLASFQPEDAEWFFGRENLTERLIALATATTRRWRTPATGVHGVPLVVVGPSGSGKSSLLRAGLIPGLSAGMQPGALRLFTPGATPLMELARQLAAPAGPAQDEHARIASASAIAASLRAEPTRAGRFAQQASSRLAIVVDQFEEVLTACPDEEERKAFIAAICALPGPAIVVLALRADFYDRALRYPGLARALQQRQVVIGPMSADEVRRAIVEPARLAGLSVEDGLVALLLRDLASRTASAAPGAGHEAGALPLLSHALFATWEHSRGGSLTVADYQASGGIQDAIARTAEEAYASLDEAGKHVARRLFLHLVRVSDDAPDTRSIVAAGELQGWPDGDAQASAVLARFVDQRLITLDVASAQITHDALLTAWPRLHAWITADREALLVRRRISEAARSWEDAGRDRSALWRGGQLAMARDWTADAVNAAGLTPLARDFVAAGTAEEQTGIQAERNRSRRLRHLVAALTVLVVATIGLTGYAFSERALAIGALGSATAARNEAQSREVAIEADQIRPQDAAVSAQLSLVAYRIEHTADARASLLEASGSPSAARLVDSGGVVESVSLSPGSRGRRVLAVAAADGTLRLWDLSRPGQPRALGAPLLPRSNSPLYATAFSPDGDLLAAAGAGHTVALWDVRDTNHPVEIGKPLTGPASTVYSVAFSPGGDVLAAGSADRTIRLWRVAPDGKATPAAKLTGPASFVQSVAFSPDGATLAAGSADKTVRLWNVSDPSHAIQVGKPLTGPRDIVDAVAFSPDGKTLAAGSYDDKVWLWNVAQPARPVAEGTLRGAAGWVAALAFSPDGAEIAAGSSDDRVLVWNLASRTITQTLPHPQPVTSLAWDGSGHLVTGNADGAVRTWALPTPVLRAGGPVNSVAYRPDGRLLAVGGTALELWNPLTRTQIAARTIPGTNVNAVAFAPGGRVLATGYENGLLQLWRVSDAGRLAALGAPVQASASGLVEFTTFSRDGKMLATAGDDGTARLWSVTGSAAPRLLSSMNDAGVNYVFSVAFSPDGQLLAAASGDNLTRLWDIRNPAHPTRLGKPLAGMASYAISVAFSPDGRTLAVGSADKTVRLWNIAHPAEPVPLTPPLTGPQGYVYSVAFGPGGRTLAAGVTDGSVWLWNTGHPAHPTLLADLTGPAGHVYSVSFSPGGRNLAAGSADGSVRIWDTGAGPAAASVCAMAGQPLTQGEWKSFLPGRAYQPPCVRS